jgi:hypothetical protein
MRLFIFNVLRFIAVLTVAGLCSCSRPVEGQAFVVTSGAGNYKLGLVPIFLLNQGELDKAISAFNKRIETLQGQLSMAQDKEKAMSKSCDEASHKSDASKTPMDVAAQKLTAFNGSNALSPDTFDGNPDNEGRESVKRFITEFQEYRVANAAANVLASTGSDSGAMLRAGNDETAILMSHVPKFLFQQLKTRLEPELNGTSKPDSSAIAGELVKIATKYYSEWKRLSEVYEKQSSVYSSDIDEAAAAQDRLQDATAATKRAEEALTESSAEMFDALKGALSTVAPITKTDGDGKFRLPDVRSQKCLLAYAERAVGSDTERYCWMIDLSDPRALPKPNEIILSNDNLTPPKSLIGP